MSKINKKLIKIVGNVIMIVSFIFIIKTVSLFSVDYKFFMNQKVIIYIFLFAVIYAGMTFLLAYIWKINLNFFSGSKVDYCSAGIVYVKANIGKYLPGNIMHYAGRNFFSKNLGLNHAQIVASTVIEIVMLCFTCGIWSIIFSKDSLIFIVKKYTDNWKSADIRLVFLIIFILVSIVTAVLYKKKRSFFHLPTKKALIKFLKLCGLSFITYTIVLLTFALILVLIMRWSMSMTPAGGVLIGASFLVSWLCGFLIPGAPGGIGVREAVLIIMLKNTCGTEAVLLSAVIQRLVSIFGDVLAWLIGILIDKYKTNFLGDTVQ